MSETLRRLGSTGASVFPFSLGGEGVLRTYDRASEAVAVILEALGQGVRYCDTAPAYASSQDYYGLAFREAGSAARDKVFLASKTHIRTREGALALLDESLKRLGTDRLDLWQMHDLRDKNDLKTIFGKGGAIEAAEKAKADGRARFIGLTGHHDPAILVEAMRRYPFDAVLVALNPADPQRMPFESTVVAEARGRNMAVIGMKVLAAGRLTADGTATHTELIRYAATVADTVVIGCSSPVEVRQNMEASKAFTPMSKEERRALEERVAARGRRRYDYFKRD